jgi:DNA polymerase phi
VRRQPSSKQIVRMVVPLIQVVRSAGADEEQLSKKTSGFLQSRIGKLKDVPTDIGDDHTDAIRKDLETVHDFARKSPSPAFSSLVTDCSAYISRVLIHIGQASWVQKVYLTSLEDFAVKKRTRLNANFVYDFVKRQTGCAWRLHTPLVEFCLPGKAANTHRQCQIFHLLQTLVTQVPVGPLAKALTDY